MECLEVRNRCPKLLTRPLLPEAATEHALRAVPDDNRARRWRPHPESEWELLYSCRRGQIDWSSPEGVTLPLMAYCFGEPHCSSAVHSRDLPVVLQHGAMLRSLLRLIRGSKLLHMHPLLYTMYLSLIPACSST